MARFNLKQIEAFVTVADLGSFRRSAARLNTTQPNISNRISQLEQAIGQVLMERDAGSVRLTREGSVLLPEARGILASVDRFLAATQNKAAFEGVLRLGVSELVAHIWLRPFLQAMKEQFPAIDVELTVDLSATLSRALFARDLDLVLQSGPFEQASRHTLPLGQSPYVWVAAPSLDLPHGRITAAQLAAVPILSHARGTAPFAQLDEHFRAIRQPVRLVPSSNIAVGLQMAQDGLGIACLPQDMLADTITEGRLRIIHYDWRPAALCFAARWNLEPTPTYVAQAALIAQGLYPPLIKE